jgi:hypothetical protein
LEKKLGFWGAGYVGNQVTSSVAAQRFWIVKHGGDWARRCGASGPSAAQVVHASQVRSEFSFSLNEREERKNLRVLKFSNFSGVLEIVTRFSIFHLQGPRALLLHQFVELLGPGNDCKQRGEWSARRRRLQER